MIKNDISHFVFNYFIDFFTTGIKINIINYSENVTKYNPTIDNIVILTIKIDQITNYLKSIYQSN